ncbi:MAG: biotin/lipoyl-binding protein [Alphaproteobacteria bacterium]|nr:biotin/lipoyl-binding protein [Alphaproteobacteria bacterium]
MVEIPQPPSKKARQDRAIHLPYPRHTTRIAGRATYGFVIIMALSLIVLGGWAATTEIDRVTRGQGRIVPQLQNQIVQHFEGGIVTEILVREGDRVTRGEPLLRIDNSFSRSELAQAELEIKARRVKMIRLTAEVGGAENVEFPADLESEIPKIVDRVPVVARHCQNRLAFLKTS